ncbi:MAG: flagellar basal body rod protein FlgC [Candidatus Eisenbacteria bacterium]|nr:flagellar basal body rod protein FlgC [Candidatus Eisenbacteria bacterium]
MSNDLFGALGISASGLSAQRKRMETIAKNIANAETTRSEEGGPYRRRQIVISSDEGSAPSRSRAAEHRVSLTRTSPGHLGGSAATRPGAAAEGPSLDAREVVDESAGFELVFDPAHPDADEKGYVRVPDISTITEMVDMVAATRAYEANLTAMKAYQSIVSKSLEI